MSINRRLGQFLLSTGIWLTVVVAVAVVSWAFPASPSRATHEPPPLPTLHPNPMAIARSTALIAQAADGAAVNANLVESVPENGAIDVLIDAPIELQFDGLVSGEVDQLEITLDPKVELAFNSEGDRLVLQPAEPLAYSTDYTLEIPLQDALPLSEPVKLEFKTEPQYTYVRDVQPILNARCVACHGTTGRFKSSSMDTYTTASNYIEPNSPDSRLIQPQYVTRHSRIDPRAGSLERLHVRKIGADISLVGEFQPNELDIVKTWIVQDGAPEDATARR